MKAKMITNIKILILLPLLIAGVVIFFKFPDLDISLLGIGKHRHFLFHSAFFPAAVYLLIRFIFKRKIFITIFRLPDLGALSVDDLLEVFT